jgi:aldehyde:ferredoxin oxidoreductase
VEGIGDLEGTEVEHRLFTAGTGVDWSLDEFNKAVSRVLNVERALQVRHWGRDRAMDEGVFPFFERPESTVNPLMGERKSLDRAAFKPVVDEFYRLHGWNENGWPTRERLTELGIGDVYGPMVRGAKAAREKNG